MRSRLCTVLLATFLVIIGPAVVFAQYDAPSSRVLVLHSYGTDFQWTRDLDAGVRGVLQRNRGEYATVSSEFLNGKYHFDQDYLESLARHLAVKYQGREFDALIVTDNLALDFAREYRDEIFGPVPTVFAGINDYELALVAGLSRITGIPEEVSVEETLRLAFGFSPGGRLVVLGDGTLTYRRNETVLRRALQRIDHDYQVDIYPEVSIAEVERLSHGIQPGDVVLLAASILESDGAVADFHRAGTIVSDLMPVPVYVMWDFFMGTGVAGGFLVSGREQGRAAGDMARSILSGTPADTIPVHSNTPRSWIFDMEPLREAGIERSLLPEGAVIYNADTSLWSQYRTELSWLVVVVMVLGTLIVLLIESRRNRVVAAHHLKESLSEKEILLKEIHHRVKNNLQVISSILNIQSGFISDEQALSYFKDCEIRVQSMALVHEQLYQSESLARIHLPSYLDELLSSLYSAMTRSTGDITVRREIADLSLHLDQAIPVGLLVNELVSNALKYAYPDQEMRPGEVSLHIARSESGLQVCVRDWGVGLDHTIQHTDSLGLQLVDALTAQLRGSVQFEQGDPGLVVRIQFPLVEVA